MDLTVIIADSTDLRIKNCIESIDEDIEVLVSLNGPSKELFDLVKEMNVKYCFLPNMGLAAALNNGIKHASNSKIIIIDSDCTFKEGTIRKLCDALDRYPMVRGVQITRFDGFLSQIISKAREFHGNTNPDSKLDEIMAYKPLAYKKEVAKLLGGEIYNPKLKLSEDFEMNERRKSAGVKLGFIPDAIIYHDPISIKSDLKSAFMYGSDRHTMVELGLTKPKKTFLQSLKKLRKKCYLRFGFGVTAYMVLWTSAYDLGYFKKKLSKWWKG